MWDTFVITGLALIHGGTVTISRAGLVWVMGLQRFQVAVVLVAVGRTHVMSQHQSTSGKSFNFFLIGFFLSCVLIYLLNYDIRCFFVVFSILFLIFRGLSLCCFNVTGFQLGKALM